MQKFCMFFSMHVFYHVKIITNPWYFKFSKLNRKNWKCFSSLKTSSRSSRPEMFLGKGVLKICSKFRGEHPYRSVISLKLQSNFIEIALWHGCAPVNLLHIVRTRFARNTSGWLLLLLDVVGCNHLYFKCRQLCKFQGIWCKKRQIIQNQVFCKKSKEALLARYFINVTWCPSFTFIKHKMGNMLQRFSCISFWFKSFCFYG